MGVGPRGQVDVGARLTLPLHVAEDAAATEVKPAKTAGFLQVREGTEVTDVLSKAQTLKADESRAVATGIR